MIFGRGKKFKVIYFAENADWIIKRIGIEIKKRLNGEILDYKIISSYSDLEKCDVLHFGSRSIIDFKSLPKIRKIAKKIVLTWFHGDDEDLLLINGLVSNANYIDLIHTASTFHAQKLINWGIPKNKVLVIPLGVDNKLFTFKTLDSKRLAREKLGLNKEDIIIGSFQKDGNGWENGDTPKLIKGPDIFCDVVKKLSEKIDLKVLLTGPSRGYVINSLASQGIPFVHHFLENYEDIVSYFHAIDLYLVTSRNEGGPMAILESFATGTPIISSKVGMAPDLIISGTNGYICNVGDIENYINCSLDVLTESDIESLHRAKIAALSLDWDSISIRYFKEIYG